MHKQELKKNIAKILRWKKKKLKNENLQKMK